LLAFKNVDFGQPLYLSDVYGTVEPIAGVAAMTITRFRREDSPTIQIADQLQQLGISALVSLPSTAGGTQAVNLSALIQRAVQIDVATDGRIDIREFEIPVLGTLDVQLTESMR
jgi:hypothetical protein